MTRKYFRQLETSPQGTSFNAKELLEQLSWNDQGLIPVITQEQKSKRANRC